MTEEEHVNCPFCGSNDPKDLTPEERAKNRDDAQALADVRTLDDWAEQAMQGVQIELANRNARKQELIANMMRGYFGTPDEARAKAAAWVREQKAGPQGFVVPACPVTNKCPRSI